MFLLSWLSLHSTFRVPQPLTAMLWSACRVLARSRFLERVLDAVNGAETGSAAEDAENVVSVLYQLLGQQCLLEDGEVCVSDYTN